MTRVVIAPDSFKGSLAAAGVAEAIAQGWLDERPDDEIVLLPLADGGEGTLDALAAAAPESVRMPVEVTGPHDLITRSEWLYLPPAAARQHSIGVVELANTSGIELLDEQLRPFTAHTLGFGQAIAAALDHGVDELVLGIGSSASTDGGLGMLRALGAEFVDAAGEPVELGATGVGEVSSIDLSGLRPLPARGVTVLSDVSAPLCGPDGAAAVFGPQKGLSTDDIARVDAALGRYSMKVVEAVESSARHASFDVSVAPPGSPLPLPEQPGAGAAGGTGFGLLAWGATLVSGGNHVAQLLNLAEHCAQADLIITGEGRFDAQSLLGKVPGMVLDLAATVDRPVALIAGSIAADAPLDRFAAACALTSFAPTPDDAISTPTRYAQAAAKQVAREALPALRQ